MRLRVTLVAILGALRRPSGLSAPTRSGPK